MSLYLNLTIPSFLNKRTIYTSNTWRKRLPYERSIELEYGKIDNTFLTIDLSLELKGSDHAGPSIELSIFGYGFRLEIPKARHWNYEENCWL